MKNKDDLIIKVNGKIVKYSVKRRVVKSGGSGSITLPKDLIGKIIQVKYENGKNE